MMIYAGTGLKVLDKSGAKLVQCIKILRVKQYASVGDVITISVKTARVRRSVKIKRKRSARKGEIYRALVVSTNRTCSRPFGYSVSFFLNSCVLLKRQENVMFSNRLRGMVNRVLRFKGFARIASTATNSF